MAEPSFVLGSLESQRKKEAVCSAVSQTGMVSGGAYHGQHFSVIAARRGFPSWYRVILKDESGVVERDIREKYL